MSSYKGWLKITSLLNVILTAVCNGTYAQQDVRIFLGGECVFVYACGWRLQ